MTFLRRSIVAAAAIALLTMPRAPFGSGESGLLAQGRLPQLRGVEELKSWFNTYKGHTRLIFLLSPT